jgi:hypothetical protein
MCRAVRLDNEAPRWDKDVHAVRRLKYSLLQNLMLTGERMNPLRATDLNTVQWHKERIRTHQLLSDTGSEVFVSKRSGDLVLLNTHSGISRPVRGCENTWKQATDCCAFLCMAICHCVHSIPGSG